MRRITMNLLKLKKSLSAYAPASLFGFSFYALFGRKSYLPRGFKNFGRKLYLCCRNSLVLQKDKGIPIPILM